MCFEHIDFAKRYDDNVRDSIKEASKKALQLFTVQLRELRDELWKLELKIEDVGKKIEKLKKSSRRVYLSLPYFEVWGFL